MKFATVSDAIDFTLGFYDVTPTQAALRGKVDLAGIPPPLGMIYRRLGGLLECSLASDGYPPFRPGACDLEFPGFDESAPGVMFMSDSQAVGCMCLGEDPAKAYWYFDHGENEDGEVGPPDQVHDLESFLTDWLIGDLLYRRRWKIELPDLATRFDRNKPSFEQLRPGFWALGDTLLLTDERQSGHGNVEVGSFIRPAEPLQAAVSGGAIVAHSNWNDPRLDAWEAKVRAR
jgi:hypothetical protein